MKLYELQNKLSKLKCFTPLELKRYSGLSEGAVHKIIWRYVKKGIFSRIRNNLYLFNNSQRPPLWLIANKIYAPSYVSFETALSYYGFIPETVYSTTSATSKITRHFVALDVNFTYRKLKMQAFAGYKPVTLNDSTTLVAEPEKAIADYLYFVHLKKINMNDRLRIKGINKSRLHGYIRLFENDSFEKWVKTVLSSIYNSRIERGKHRKRKDRGVAFKKKTKRLF